MEFRRVNCKIPSVWLRVLVVLSASLWLVSATSQEVDFEPENEDTTPWISARQPGRFLLNNAGGRNSRGQNWCGGGRAPDFACRLILPRSQYRNPRCCWSRNNRRCFDVGANNDLRCGSCTHSCRPTGRKCCGGVCVNLLSNRDNCGRCGNRCRRGVSCRNAFCGYNGN